jgi:DNA-binding transcriptional LysR family regulator
MAVVGSPSYFTERKRPKAPQDLMRHNCLNLRLPTHGGSLYAWEFEKTGVNSMFVSKGSLSLAVCTFSWKGRSGV